MRSGPRYLNLPASNRTTQRCYYYDVNANSNFVADAQRVVGFAPFARLVDWLEEEAERAVVLGKEAA